MKKLIYALIFLMIVAGVQAEEITFEYEQAISPDFAGWNIYQSHTPGGPYQKVMTLSYNGTPSGTYQQDYDIPEVVGDSLDYYFVFTAFDTSGNESVYSNEAKWTAEDTTAPLSPQKVKITIKQVSE
ncbi:MAG: hypothetical protein PVI43_01515 [Candidatus Bathyarchaeota archaeon]|jgi:hypothetical protein